jgi:hypothetical protein
MSVLQSKTRSNFEKAAVEKKVESAKKRAIRMQKVNRYGSDLMETLDGLNEDYNAVDDLEYLKSEGII